MTIDEFNLNEDIFVQVIHFAPLAVGLEIYRVIFEIYTTKPSTGLLKEYEVWLYDIYVADREHLANAPTKKEILNFAKNYLINRYKYSGNIVPTENGAYLTNETGEVWGNPRSFSIRTTDKTQPVKTTLMLPKETHKWLKTYAVKKEIGIGEVVRRLVASYNAGTASPESVIQKDENGS